MLVTLTGSSGASPVLGRRAWALADGSLRGLVTLGGCAAGQLLRAAQAVRSSGEAQRVRVDLGSGDAYEFGLTCSGWVEAHLQLADPAAPLWEALTRERAAGRSVWWVMPLGPVGASEIRPAPEHSAVLGQPQVWRRGEGAGEALWQLCLPPLHLVLAGSGPVARPLTDLAAPFGLKVSLSDDVPERLTPASFPAVHEFCAVPTGQDLILPPLTARSAVVVLSHDYAHELSVLERALASPAPYIALVANRRRGQALLRFLQETTHLAPAVLDRVRTPAGLDLGLTSPAGIALSILSEIAQHFGGGTGRSLSDRSATP